jgi:hypothetical protein
MQLQKKIMNQQDIPGDVYDDDEAIHKRKRHIQR